MKEKDGEIVKYDRMKSLSMDGSATTESGKMTKHKYFKFLNNSLDNYSDMQFTPTEARKVHNHIQKLSTGSSAMIPMYCGGEVCPFANRCVFMEMGKPPIGKQCLTEVTLMRQWTVDFMEEFDVDPQNFTEIAYSNELAEIMVMERRLNMNLAKAENCELVTDAVMGVDREGDPIVQKQISPFMELKDKLSNRKSKIIKLMVGDRQEKYKMEAALKLKPNDDPSDKMAKMRTQLESMTRSLDNVQNGITKEEGRANALTPNDLINDLSE